MEKIMETMALKEDSYMFCLIASAIMVICLSALLYLINILIFRCGNISNLEQMTYSSLHVAENRHYRMAGEAYSDLSCLFSPATTNIFRILRYQGQAVFYTERIVPRGGDYQSAVSVYYCYGSKVQYIGGGRDFFLLHGDGRF
jgi:hypothetical protein